ncbi:unnamed protein product [Rotaria sp. Silwood2]|nr:unnamed protein product [Rotaria sp. Silwood2]CAF4221021.1 unnamed protein product [Rotaria sp. Silwood2]
MTHPTTTSKISFPPIVVKFIGEQQTSIKEITDDLISKWKNQHGIDLTITARFGYLHSLLIFSDDSSTFESLLDPNRWPKALKEVDIEVKVPRQLPPAYSLIIQQFHRNWNEDEWLIELQQRYVSLYKITRMRVKDGSPLNAVRADFKSIEEVKTLIRSGKINVGSMIHPVKPYHLPIRVNKCLKCLKHDHTTRSCTRRRLCPRCAEEHSLEHGCPNQERCINCGGDHISGHSACPIVQEKRRVLVEQSKRQRAELLVLAERQQHRYDCHEREYPTLGNDNLQPPSSQMPHQTAESSQKSYAEMAKQQRKQGPQQNIEYTLSSFLNKMERRLDDFSFRLSSQLCEIEKKINVYSDRQKEIEKTINEIILPSIQVLGRISSQSPKKRNNQEEFKKLNNKMNDILMNYKHQFNSYKYTELTDKLLPLMHDLSDHQKQIGIETLHDCCWTWSIQELSSYWQQQYRQPEISFKCMSLLHYNIRHFYSNQAELIDMVNVFSPNIISLNELGTTIPKKIINQLLFSYNVFFKEGTNSHGGVVLAIDKRLSCQQIETNEPNLIAVRIRIDDQQFVVASIYSPPTEQLPLTTMTKLVNEAKNVIIAGDLNAKHPDWGCPQVNTKGRELANWLIQHNLNVLNGGIKSSLRSNTTIDLVISGEIPEASESKSLSYTGSDHLPILTKFFRLNVLMDKHVVPRTYWKIYSSILTVLIDQFKVEQENSSNSANNAHKWFLILEQFLAALKLRVTIWKEVKRKRPSISPSLQVLLRHKHYLQNRYRHSRLEEDRLRLRSWNVIVKQEFQALKQRSWEQFISNVASPNPSSFWRTVKKLNKKKSVDFSALTEANITHRSPVDIVKCLSHHFTERHALSSLNMTNILDKEADELWKLFSLADTDDIKLLLIQSDLQFIHMYVCVYYVRRQLDGRTKQFWAKSMLI